MQYALEEKGENFYVNVTLKGNNTECSLFSCNSSPCPVSLCLFSFKSFLKAGHYNFMPLEEDY